MTAKNRRPPTKRTKALAIFMEAMRQGRAEFTHAARGQVLVIWCGAGEYSIQVGALVGHEWRTNVRGTLGACIKLLKRLV